MVSVLMTDNQNAARQSCFERHHYQTLTATADGEGETIEGEGQAAVLSVG